MATRRVIVMLSGRREYEVADGEKFVATPGSISIVEDVTGQGHKTRGLGNEAVNLLIPLPERKRSLVVASGDESPVGNQERIGVTG